ncbi:hypothetical protein GA0115261_103951, partial [Streptomyces sp. OspMP-M43]
PPAPAALPPGEQWAELTGAGPRTFRGRTVAADGEDSRAPRTGRG